MALLQRLVYVLTCHQKGFCGALGSLEINEAVAGVAASELVADHLHVRLLGAISLRSKNRTSSGCMTII